jgi:hypothetical protein
MAFKEDLQASVAELVYSELLTPTADPVDPAHLITKLQQHVAYLRPVLAAHHASPAKFVHSELEKYTHVFLHQDTMCQALESPTVAPIRSYQGQRRCCNSSCAGGPSQCQPTFPHSPQHLRNHLCMGGGGDVGTSHSAKQATPTVQQELAIFIHYSLQPGCLYTHTSTTESELTVEAPVPTG